MIISKKNRHAVYKYLYNEGVLYAEKDYNLPQHPDIPEVSNLEVIKLMQSFKSKQYVNELFAWRHYYWFLTNAGITYIREYLSLPENIKPKTLKKDKQRTGERRPGGGRGPPGQGRGYGGDDGGRQGYRSGFGRGAGGDKAYGSAPGQYEPQYASAPEGRWDANKP